MFLPEMLDLCSGPAETAYNLKHYISPECWRAALPLIDNKHLQNVDAINTVMERLYDEKRPHLDLLQEFVSYKQTISDVQIYTAQKIMLFTRAYPQINHQKSVEFREGWLQGLAPPLALEVARIKPSYLAVEWTDCLNVCIDEENAQKKLNISYEVHSRINTHQSTQSPSNSNKDKKKGKRGKRKSQTPATLGGQSAAGATSSQPAKPATTNPNAKKYNGICHATQKCREDPNKHPYFACKNSTCKSCKILGHTHLQCPQAKCDKCHKSGHDTKVHGLDRKTPVF